MSSFVTAPARGAPLAPPTVPNGNSLATGPISGSAAIISGSGTPEPKKKAASKPSKGKPASPSQDRLDKKATARAKTTIAISLETIDASLIKMDQASRILALVEIIRRATKRLETEGVKILESLDQLDQEL